MPLLDVRHKSTMNVNLKLPLLKPTRSFNTVHSNDEEIKEQNEDSALFSQMTKKQGMAMTGAENNAAVET
jgi:hypothetical protein